MFIKPIIRNVRNSLEFYTYYRLCESFRDEFGRSKWRSVLGLGRMENFSKEQREGFILRLNEMLKGTPGLFIAAADPKVEEYTISIFNTLIDNGKIDKEEVISGKREKDKLLEKEDLVKASSIEHKEVREIGSEHLCLETAKRLKLDKFLRQQGLKEEEVSLALTQIVARAIHPASELATVDWIKKRSSICQLTGYDSTKLTKDKLYKSALMLLDQKDRLEEHLSKWTRDLFEFEDKIILYDLTNTYFEGAMRTSIIAKRGRSKEKRSDCKLLVLAMVVNQEGFPKHYQLFEGNMADSSSLVHIVNSLDEQLQGIESKPTVVMDAGIATEDSIKLLKERGYDYLCVSRSHIRDYKVVADSVPVKISDKKGQPIELLAVKIDKNDDRYLWVRSEMKALKESQMKEQFTLRFESELEKIKSSLSKKNGTKQIEKVNRRIGRAQEKYPSIQGNYELFLKTENNIAIDFTWKIKNTNNKRKNTGVYFLRTSLDETDERVLWLIYNTIREIEYTFRVLKNDLDLRPIYHKTDKASLAHIHLGILAYWLVVTIRHQLKKKGINKGWKQIVEIMDSHKLVSSTMQTPDEKQIIITRCSEPSEEVKEIYLSVNISTVPLKSQKSVRYHLENQKKINIEYQEINDS